MAVRLKLEQTHNIRIYTLDWLIMFVVHAERMRPSHMLVPRFWVVWIGTSVSSRAIGQRIMQMLRRQIYSFEIKMSRFYVEITQFAY